MIVQFTTYIHAAEIEIECHDNGTGVKAYYRGRHHLKASKWAERYLETNTGSWELYDAVQDELSARRSLSREF